MSDLFIISDLSFLSFPLNLILFLLWMTVILIMWRNHRDSPLVKFLLGSRSVILSIFLLVAASLFIGLTGKREIASSWPFILVLLYFQTVLSLVILRGWKTRNVDEPLYKCIRWRFLLLHLGLLMAVSSAFWGAPDTQELRIRLRRDTGMLAADSLTEAYRTDGTRVWLNTRMMLLDFNMKSTDEGVPTLFEAVVLIDGEDVSLRVNHPYSMGFGRDLYLSGYDNRTGACILQLVYEPWKYTARIGIIMMLAGAMLLFLKGPLNCRE